MCELAITLGTLGGVMAGRRQGAAGGRVACHAKWSLVRRARRFVSPLSDSLVHQSAPPPSFKVRPSRDAVWRTARSLNLDREHARPPRFNA